MVVGAGAGAGAPVNPSAGGRNPERNGLAIFSIMVKVYVFPDAH